MSDPSKEVAKKFGCLSRRGFSSRWTYYVDAEGKILEIDKKVKARTHGADIAEKLEELKIKKVKK